jgi:hypothetical protein
MTRQESCQPETRMDKGLAHSLHTPDQNQSKNNPASPERNLTMIKAKAFTLILLTALTIYTGQQALTHGKQAINRHIHTITAAMDQSR